MSSAAMANMRKSLTEVPWQLWARQFLAIVRVELRKALWMRRSLWIYLLAFAPAVLFGIRALVPGETHGRISDDTEIFAHIFQIFYLRAGIFFGCLGLFTWLFRGEVVEKSLHYYFLSPVRRQVLIVGKFAAGVIASALTFGASVFLSFTFGYSRFGKAGHDFVFNGPGLGHLTAYLFVTVLACLGYGAIFLALSLVFKNPILPGAALLFWETFHSVAPPLLQRLSVTFYLTQLCPVTIPPDGLMALFTVTAEPVSPWLTVPGLVILSVVVLALACIRIQRTEISYLAD